MLIRIQSQKLAYFDREPYRGYIQVKQVFFFTHLKPRAHFLYQGCYSTELQNPNDYAKDAVVSN